MDAVDPRWRPMARDWLDEIPDEHWITAMLLTDTPITKALIQKESYVQLARLFQTGND
jgi:hypothetical protein